MTTQILTVTLAYPTGPVPVLAAAGELDIDSRTVLREAADAALRDSGNRLVIDLRAVSFCDSAGLSLFVDLHRLTTVRGGALRLACTQPPVLAVIGATNLDRLLHLDPTVEQAVRASMPAD
jgi:anti-sigma B factor antagonist